MSLSFPDGLDCILFLNVASLSMVTLSGDSAVPSRDSTFAPSSDAGLGRVTCSGQ